MYSTCTEELASIHVKTVVRKFHILIKDNGWSLLPFGLCLDINSALGNIHTKCSNSPSIPGLDIYSDALHHQAPGSCILHSTWPANHELHLTFLSHSKPKHKLLITGITIRIHCGHGAAVSAKHGPAAYYASLRNMLSEYTVRRQQSFLALPQQNTPS